MRITMSTMAIVPSYSEQRMWHVQRMCIVCAAYVTAGSYVVIRGTGDSFTFLF